MTACASASMIPAVAADAPMFIQKVKAVVDARGLTAAEAARRANMDPPTLYQMMSKGTVPRAHAMAKIAAGLQLPLEYLADDDIPVEPIPRSTAQLVGYNQFRRELSYRYREEALRLLNLFDRAEAYNYADALEVVTGRKSYAESGLDEAEFSDMIEIALGIKAAPFQAFLSYAGADYLTRKYHEHFPGSDRDPDSLTISAVRKRYGDLMENKTGLEFFITRVTLALATAIGASGQRLAESDPAEASRRVFLHLQQTA